MAITRISGEKIDYPEPDTLIQEGDTYLLVGEVDELAAFKKLTEGGITQLPEDTDSSLWILVSEDSVVVGKSLAQLEFQKRFGSTIQAIRRKGKVLRFPNGNNVIQAGDKLLVFGELTFLADLGRKVATKTDIETIISD
jgi:CPA2 family monovalent cation:H+ antiporter-2